ncbi:hypothetical protein ACE3MQ_16015 [Paenibacillus lentus]
MKNRKNAPEYQGRLTRGTTLVIVFQTMNMIMLPKETIASNGSITGTTRRICFAL